MALFLTPPLVTSISIGGQSVKIATKDMTASGGMVVNPARRVDEHTAQPEVLYVSIVGPASISDSDTTTRLAPSQTFIVPKGVEVWVNAETAGHKFTGIFAKEYTVPYPPLPVPGAPGSGIGIGGLGTPFPVFHPVGLLQVIPSYLYQQYTDDDDLQGFVDAQNACQQDYVDTFNAMNLPIYPGPLVGGLLLDWVGRGLYGMARPSIGVGFPVLVGPLNTWGPAGPFEILLGANLTNYGLPAINMMEQISIGNIVVTNDDLYRRILTWHFFKGDSNYFSLRWLKRRVWRFLYGENGWPIEESADGEAFIADTKQISITIGVERNVTIRFVLGDRQVTGGALPNMWGPNGFSLHDPSPFYKGDVQLNDLETTYVVYPPLPYMSTFKLALDSGVLETPYQFNFTCTIG